MRLLLFFLLTSGLAFSQATTQNCQVYKSTYKVVIKENAYPGFDISVIVPRELTNEEVCLIKSLRREEENVVHSLDDVHEVIIYAKNKIKQE
jgi:hypothetical protein